MRTKITISVLITASFLLIADVSKAQSNWTLNGSNDIYNNNSSGFVGINETSPIYPLQIGGLISAGGLSSGGLFIVGMTTDLAAAVGNQSTAKHAIFGCMNPNKDILFPTYNGSSFDERVRITSGGNVGIGTTTPFEKLHLHSGTGDGDTYNTGFVLSRTSTTGNVEVAKLVLDDMDTNYGNLVFKVKTTASSAENAAYYTDAMTIKGVDGNVGIGTTSPDINAYGSAYKTLSILGPNTSAYSCGILEIATQSTDADGNIAGVLNFAASSNASTKRSIAQIVSFTQGSTATNRGGFMIFNTKPDGSTSTVERMRIDNLGNIGIGTASPGQKLDVAGTVQMTGFKLTTSPTNGYVLTSDAAGAATWQPASSGGITGSCSLGAYYVPKMSSTTAITCSQIYDNGTYVGIGTSNPIGKLDLYNVGTGSQDGIFIYCSGSSGSTYGGEITANGYGTENVGLKISSGATATYNYNLKLSSLTAGTNNYSIFSTSSAKSYFAGSVGIGTTNPAVKLEVTGNFNVNGIATCTNMSWSDSIVKTNIDSLHNALTTIGQLIPKSYYFDTANVYGLNFSNKKQYGFIAQDVETVLPELLLSTTKNADVDTLGNIIHPAITLKTLNYNAFIGILTKGIQELQQKNDSLETKTIAQDSTNVSLHNSLNQLIVKTNCQDSINTSLQNQLNQLLNCCNNHGNNNGQSSNLMPSDTNNYKSTPTTLTDVELSNKNIVVLNQNVPNPFAEQTTISYYLPDNVIRAQIIFTDQSGKTFKTIDLKEKGKGQLNVFANDLSNGIYTYSLIIDGQTVETKKMVKQ